MNSKKNSQNDVVLGVFDFFFPFPPPLVCIVTMILLTFIFILRVHLSTICSLFYRDIVEKGTYLAALPHSYIVFILIPAPLLTCKGRKLVSNRPTQALLSK